ncbi:MAG: 5'-3' exonuclease H3TH domain-containing protein [Thermoleophilaceae bacterium]
MPQPLLAVDAPSLLYRAFFALPTKITGADGLPVNALLGSVNILLREVEAHAPRAVVCCFGPDAAEYRVELYPGYHAARPPMPDELVPQWERAPALFEAFGWRVDRHDSLEADDLLGAHAAAERAAGGRALVLTGDRDMYQCAGDGVTVLYMKTGARGAEVVDAAEVERRYGVPPAIVPDFIALRGDPSDGLPGAKGVGEKTAADLLRRHGSLEAAVAAAAGEKPRVAAALTDELLPAYKEIATLRPVDVERPPDAATDRAGGAAAARALGMERLAARLES